MHETGWDGTGGGVPAGPVDAGELGVGVGAGGAVGDALAVMVGGALAVVVGVGTAAELAAGVVTGVDVAAVVAGLVALWVGLATGLDAHPNKPRINRSCARWSLMHRSVGGQPGVLDDAEMTAT